MRHFFLVLIGGHPPSSGPTATYSLTEIATTLGLKGLVIFWIKSKYALTYNDFASGLLVNSYIFPQRIF